MIMYFNILIVFFCTYAQTIRILLPPVFIKANLSKNCCFSFVNFNNINGQQRPIRVKLCSCMHQPADLNVFFFHVQNTDIIALYTNI